MSERARGGPPGSNDESTGSPADDLSQLRSILVGPEQARLDRLRDRLEDLAQRSDDVGEVLPDAVERSVSQGSRLRKSMQPVVEEAIEVSVRRDPSVLANALYPTIGEAIRRAVSRALAGIMQSMNEVAERSLSLRSLQWRLEALRTGKSFGEVAFTHSLLYRVEQVFLIHRETGLLLLHESAPEAVVKDADLVSAMLTAIQDFVRDSFGGSEDGRVERMQVGEFRVWVQHGPHAVLAAVISGTPPLPVGALFQKALENVHRIGHAELEAFDGDASPLEICRPEVRQCLLGRAAETKRKSSPLLWLAPLAVVGLLAFLAVSSAVESRRREAFLVQLGDRPGIVIAGAEERGGKWRVRGLRDPLAADPVDILAESDLEPDSFVFELEPYHSLSGDFPVTREIEARMESLARRRVFFEPDSSELDLDRVDQLDGVVADVRMLLVAAERVGEQLFIEIRGGSDPAGDPERNAALAAGRARAVRDILVAHGVDAQRLRTADRVEMGGQGSSGGGADWERALERVVSFRAARGQPAVAGSMGGQAVIGSSSERD